MKEMALFDAALEEARAKFNLGAGADRLLTALLALITDENRGGFAGFLDRSSAAGLGDVAASWISSGPNAPISREQTEAALGPVTLDDMAKQIGLDYETAVSASALMLPHIVNELTPDGAVTADVEARAKTYGLIPETNEAAAATFDRVGTAAVGTIEGESENTMEDVEKKDSGREMLVPLIIVVLLIVLGFWFCGKS
jgi:uncharacterized protein YidB (DUF937 family)